MLKIIAVTLAAACQIHECEIHVRRCPLALEAQGPFCDVVGCNETLTRDQSGRLSFIIPVQPEGSVMDFSGGHSGLFIYSEGDDDFWDWLNRKEDVTCAPTS